ncbi:hypothetical protein CROQUDRAFT_656141 [Cronartium quercuum f. sp. fusiforme G11]|uniref:Fe2OG dioxygenase domain-containing protein n=1 Tax=Cronartium quercuum f. sp. fusiforme G11 TaxID=708437 RepID=A0A9P6NPV2_9BASI|nr:hypothetical protein CROQUDRAFT_656141 [Cronartium quercuum f. sp. fusiforme G11]
MASARWGLRSLGFKPTLRSYSSFPSTSSAHPPQPYTLADPSPYILHDQSSGQLPSYNPLDFELYRTFFNAEEQSIWMSFLLSTLNRAHPRRRRRQSRQHTQSGVGEPVIQPDGFEPAETYDFEAGHFDAVITDYREHEIRALDRISDTSVQPLLARLTALFPPQSSLMAHILHLSPSGKIDSHLDHASASGPTIVALSLGGARVLHLLADEKSTKPVYKVLLEPGSVYLQRNSVRYSLPHAIPAIDNFAAKAIGGSQRLSLILRDTKV